MTIELLNIFVILTGGTMLVSISGMRGWGLPVLGFIVGLALMLLVGNIQAITWQPTNSIWTMLLTVFVPAGLWALYYKKKRVASFKVLHVTALIMGVTLIVMLLWPLNLLNLSPDSYMYAQLGALLESNNLSLAHPSMLLKRLLVVPLMHRPANLNGNLYLKSITPILALTTIFSLTWYCQKGLQSKTINSWTTFILPATAGLLLATNQLFVFNAFYVNGHLLYAALLLSISGSSWLYAINAVVPQNALLMTIYLSIPVLTITRPEASLHTLLAILPILASSKFHLRQRTYVLVASVLTIIIWNGSLLLKYVQSGTSVPLAVTGMLGVGIIAILGMPLFFSRLFDGLAKYILPVVETSLWIVLLALTLYKKEIFIASIIATIENIFMGVGLWGYSLIVLGTLFVGGLCLSNSPDRIFLRFPVTTFIPLGLIMAFLRGIPYRVGFFDSFNRMFLHIVPLAILFVVSSAFTTRRGLQKTLSQKISPQKS